MNDPHSRNPDPSTNGSPDENDPSAKSTMRWLKRGAVGVLVLLALGYGAIFFYANVINDAPDALGEDDLSAALDTPTPTTVAPAAGDVSEDVDVPEGVDDTGDVPGDVPGDSTAATTSVAVEPVGFDGVWTPTAASEFGYRVEEVLAGVNTTAAGRSNEIDGSLTIDNSTAMVDVSVQIASITSDDSRRDNQFTGRIMDAANFPTATFRTTEPIDFGAIPAIGEQVKATATGELTLKGVTRAVVIDVTTETDGDSIGVFGNIPVLFEDYGIANPSNAAVKTEDNGLVEFVLVFERSDAFDEVVDGFGGAVRDVRAVPRDNLVAGLEQSNETVVTIW